MVQCAAALDRRSVRPERLTVSTTFEWATRSGDAWSERWREIDFALADLDAQLNPAIAAAAPQRPFRALDVGCGAGSTSKSLVEARPDASITACDLSPALVELAEGRLAGNPVRVLLGDAEQVAASQGPFDLIFSRHGVMFFPDPVRAFRSFRAAASAGASLVFSCFQDWSANPWASELASAAADRVLPPPGREPSGFAFAEPDYVGEILSSAGWTEVEWRSAPFRYLAAGGAQAAEQALSFLGEIGPASRVIRELPEQERDRAVQRMRGVIERHFDGEKVEFAAAAWIWSAKAGEPAGA
jgi:SAM-dependent methyltransferase